MRLALLMIVFALTASACAGESRYVVSSREVVRDGIELKVQPCVVSVRCDFLYVITNNTDRCVAFHDLELPGHNAVFFDHTFNVPLRLEQQSGTRGRYTFVALPAGRSFSQSVDFRRITGVQNLDDLSLVMTIHFQPCATLGVGADRTELQSPPISFTRQE